MNDTEVLQEAVEKLSNTPIMTALKAAGRYERMMKRFGGRPLTRASGLAKR